MGRDRLRVSVLGLEVSDHLGIVGVTQPGPGVVALLAPEVAGRRRAGFGCRRGEVGLGHEGRLWPGAGPQLRCCR